MSDSFHLHDAGARGGSPVHRLDGRVKLLLALVVVVYAVSLGERGELPPFEKFAALEAFLLATLAVAGVSWRRFGRRVAAASLFALPIILLQPFVQPTTTPVYLGPITLSRDGLVLSGLLASRVAVSMTALLGLSLVSPVEEVVDSLRGLGVPREFAVLLELFVRQLFVLTDVASRTLTAASSRGFRGSDAPYLWRVRSLAAVMGTVAVRAFEKGDRAYGAMVSRGYDGAARGQSRRTSLGRGDLVAALSVTGLVAAVEILF